MTIHLLANDKDEIMTLNLPRLEFWINQPLLLKFDASMAFSDRNLNNANALMDSFSKSGLEDFKIMARFKAPLLLFGIQVYTGMPLYKEIKIGDMQPNLKSLKSLMPSMASTPSVVNSTDPLPGSLLRTKFKSQDIYQVTPTFPIVWSKLEMGIRDEGMLIDFGLAFENPVPLTIDGIEGIEINLALENRRAIQFVIDRIALGAGLQEMEINIQINFIADGIETVNVPKSIEEASKQFAETGGFGLALAGPMRIKGADFVQRMTEPINVDFSVKDTLDSFTSESGSSDLLSPVTDLLSASGVKSLLGNSSIDIKILADRISTKAGLALPVFLPIPREISFPYSTIISIHGGKPVPSEQAVQINLSSLMITRTNTAIIANTSVDVFPTNSEAAALGLAQSINPIMAAVPIASSVGLKLSFSSFDKPSFKWCDLLFSSVINFGLPPICKSCLLKSSASSISSVPITQLATVKSLDIKQLAAQPGFNAKGSVYVAYPPGLPSLSIDIGYFHLGATVESSNFIAIELPTGLKFFPKVDGTDVDASMILARNAEFGSKAQRFVNAVLLGDALPSYAGIANLEFGMSLNEKILTFRHIVVDVSTDDIISLTASQGTNSATSMLTGLITPGMLKVKGVDFGFSSSTEASLKISSVVKNPIPNMSFSMGTLAVDIILQDQTLLSLYIQPIRLQTGSAPLAISVGMKFATGANGLDAKVAQLASAVLSNDVALGLFAGINGLKISPPGVSSGPGVIDQLESVKIQVKSGKIIQMLNAPASSPSALDTSSIMPGPAILTQLKPTVSFVQLDVLPGGLMKTGGDIGYANPLPLSISIPYISLTTVIAGTDTITIELVGMQLVRNAGTIRPRLNLLFKKDASIPDNVARLLNNFLEGKISPSVGLRNIYFGTSLSSRNDLLHSIDADLTGIASGFASNGPKFQQKAADILKSMLAAKSSSSSPVASLQSAAVQFYPTSVIDANIKANVMVPMEAIINIPYFQAGSLIDGVAFADLELRGIAISGKGSNKLSLASSINIHDTDALAEKIAAIANALDYSKPLPGSIGGGHLTLGSDSSPENVIDTFSKVFISLPLDPISQPFLQSSTTFDPTPYIKNLGLELGQIKVNTAPGKLVQSSIAAGFTNGFEISVKGLGFIAASSGIDGVTLVELNANGISLQPGKNNLLIGANLHFPSSSAIQDKVAGFADHIMSSGIGNLTELITASGIAFGFDETHHFKFMSTALLGIHSSTILNPKTVAFAKDQLGFSGNIKIDPIALLSLVSVQKMHVDGSEGLLIGAGVSIKNMSFSAEANIGYASVGALVNQESLMDVHVTSGLRVKSLNGVVALDVTNSIVIYDSSSLQNSISTILDQTVAGGAVDGSAGITGLSFGFDQNPQNVIDSFSKASFSLKINDYISTVRSVSSDLYNYVTSSTNTSSLFPTIDQIVVDVNDERTLLVSFGATFTSLKSYDYYINIPYFQTGILWDSRTFGFTQVNDILYKEGVFSATTRIGFPASDSDSQQFVTLIGNLVFHRNQTLSNKVSVINIGFGPSEAGVIKTFSKAKATLGINDYVQVAGNYMNTHRPFELHDIQAKVMPEGISAPTSIKVTGLPIIILAKRIEAKLNYQIQGVGREYTVCDVLFSDFHIDNLEDPNLNIMLLPDVNPESGIAPALEDDLPLLLSFQDFAQFALLGYIKIIGSNDVAFMPLAHTTIEAPDLILWHPITINVLPTWPITSEGFQVPFKTTVSLPNAGPLHLDMGSILIEVKDNGKDVLKVTSPGDLIIRNILEGGNDEGGAGNPTHGEFHITLPFRDANPVVFIQLIRDLISHKERFELKLRFLRDDNDIPWVEEVVRQIASSGKLKNILPVLGMVLAHFKVELLGLDISQTKIYRELINVLEKWVHNNIPTLGSSIPSVGMDVPVTTLHSNETTSLKFGNNATLHVRGLESSYGHFRIIAH